MNLVPTDFLAPERRWFLLFVVAIGVAYLVLGATRKSFTMRFTNLPLLETVAPRRPGWRRHLTALTFLAAITTLVIAWARPADEVTVPKERATIILAIDTSLSMEAGDVAPSRIEAAKVAALEFVDSLPAQYNLGLVSFDGIARVRVTPTTDRAPVRSSIQNLELGEATAIGEAILAGIDAVDSAPIVDADGELVPAVMVVMTDGKTTVGRPDQFGADAAIDRGIPVSTIAFGTDRGSIVIEGEVQPVPVEVVALRDIADQTGGQFFKAESLGELQNVYADIGSSIGFDTELQEISEQWVGYAVVLLLLSSALSLAFFQRIP